MGEGEVSVSMTLLRLVTLGPALLVSFVLIVVLSALLPPALGLVLFLATAGVLVALFLGRLEETSTAVLTRSRPATESEFGVMAPALADLGGRGVEVGALYVRRSHRTSTPAAWAVADRTVVVTPALVGSTYRGDLTVLEAAAVLAQAVGRCPAIRSHLEVALLAATMPWRMAVATFRRVGEAFIWLPFMGMAWTLRGVVGVACVVQSTTDGRVAPGLLGGAIIALTYLLPAAGRGIEIRTEAAADQLVLELGLGGVLAGLLRRSGNPVPVERLQRLEAPRRPRLHLVRG